jgi:hypothetical protein
MTLVVTVNGPDTIWAACDRRLTVHGALLRDDAQKIMLLETPAADGAPSTPGDAAILVYAGLGQTAAGVEPADWMSRVLRGRGMALEPSLQVLANAVREQLPAHLRQLAQNGGGVGHFIFVPAIVGNEIKLYSIDYVIAPDGQGYWRHTRHVTERAGLHAPRAPRIAAAGSGAAYLAHQPQRWMRPLLRLVRGCDAGRVNPLAVADHLARLNHEVHRADPLVGPRCVVAWRSRRGAAPSGAAHQFYTREARDSADSVLPAISYGRDMKAFLDVFAPHAFARLRAMMDGGSADLNYGEIEKAIDALPTVPDEKLP